MTWNPLYIIPVMFAVLCFVLASLSKTFTNRKK